MCATKIVIACLLLFVSFDLAESGNGWFFSKSRHRRPPYHRPPYRPCTTTTTTTTSTTTTTPTTPTSTDQIRCELSGPQRTCLQMNCPPDNQFPDFFCPGPFPCCQIDVSLFEATNRAIQMMADKMEQRPDGLFQVKNSNIMYFPAVYVYNETSTTSPP